MFDMGAVCHLGLHRKWILTVDPETQFSPHVRNLVQISPNAIEIWPEHEVLKGCHWRLTSASIFTALHLCSRGLPISICLSVSLCLSVRPSVRPSVCQTRLLWQNETNICLLSYTIWKVDSSIFPTRSMVGGGHSLLPEILGQTDPTAWKTAISNRCSLVAPQLLDLAKKSQWLIGSRLRAFQWA